MSPRKSPGIIGHDAEQLAESHLQARGLRTLARNFRCKAGEIDLIMEDGDTLVFVEVRYRGDTRFGCAAASISWHKRQRLIRSAQYYLLTHGGEQRPCRFDVVAAHRNPSGQIQFDWISNAFESD